MTEALNAWPILERLSQLILLNCGTFNPKEAYVSNPGVSYNVYNHFHKSKLAKD